MTPLAIVAYSLTFLIMSPSGDIGLTVIGASLAFWGSTIVAKIMTEDE